MSSPWWTVARYAVTSAETSRRDFIDVSVRANPGFSRWIASLRNQISRLLTIEKVGGTPICSFHQTLECLTGPQLTLRTVWSKDRAERRSKLGGTGGLIEGLQCESPTSMVIAVAPVYGHLCRFPAVAGCFEATRRSQFTGFANSRRSHRRHIDRMHETTESP